MKKEIEKYITKNKIENPCHVTVEILVYRYNLKAFNISTNHGKDNGLPLAKSTIKGIETFFYSGLENYVNDSIDLRLHEVSSSCLQAGMQLTIDSVGQFRSIDNFNLYMFAELPRPLGPPTEINK